MDIRKKLTLWFLLIVSFILIISSIAIYLFSSDYREDDFYNRLLNKGKNTAKLLIEVDGVDAVLLRKIEKDNPVSLPNEKISIYNYKNELLFSTDDEEYIKIDTNLFNRIRLEREVRWTVDKHEVVGFLFADTYDRFVVITGAVDIFGKKKLENLRLILLIVFLVSFFITFIFGWLFTLQFLRPIKLVVDQVNEIGVHNLNQRVDEGNEKDEIAHLAKTFNRMLDRLETAFKHQKNFIANASHELRTPLTAITAQLEVMLLKEREKEEYKQVLASVLEDMKNLNLTSNRLLLLAQTNSENNNVLVDKVRVDEVIWSVKKELQKRFTDYKINVEFDEKCFDEENLTVLGNEQLIKTVFLNLAENGCKYSKDKSVNVYFTASKHHIKVLFKDSGIGIPKEEFQNIFQPFHRAKNAITYKGHGLGLSLVDRIVKIHQGSISFQSEMNVGSTFTVQFPK